MTTNTITLTGRVESGKLPGTIMQQFEKLIRMAEGKWLEITIEQRKRKRSLNQNAYWFKMLDEYVVDKFRDAGSNWSNYKIHCHLMHELGYEEALIDPKGRIVASRMESHEFSTMAWEEYMERARAYIAEEYKIEIPLPNEEIASQAQR